MVSGTSQLFPGGPPVAKAALGYDITKEDLGGEKIHVYESGVTSPTTSGKCPPPARSPATLRSVETRSCCFMVGLESEKRGIERAGARVLRTQLGAAAVP